MKYIFVAGGVMSGIGKGIASSSISRILKSKGYTVTALKIDPYINVDAGTMNPTEHGEVFVLDDGYETDQDMGNYERFLDETLPSINYMTTGRVYQEVIRKERNLEYGGKTVQVVPDVPLDVIRRIKAAGSESKADIVVIEIGGTVGDYDNILFLEAARLLKHQHPHDVANVLVSYVHSPNHIGEMKTKPTQHANRELNAAGLQADIILARATVPLDQKRKEKIATFCNVLPERVISAPDVESIYDVPLNFEKDGLGDILCDVLGLKHRPTNLKEWEGFVAKVKNGSKKLQIAVVGKYFMSGDYVLSDVYISVIEALKHACADQNVGIKLSYLDSEEYEKDPKKLEQLRAYDGIVVPGGFGSRGVEGIVLAIEFARVNKIPYLGLCYGMQWMVIEYARNVAGLKNANTAEVNPDAPHKVIDLMVEQKDKMSRQDYGGTMRLGGYPCVLHPKTIAKEAYGASEVRERHRHRYEVNMDYIKPLSDAGLVFSGTSPDGRLMEIAELPKSVHPFMLGTQFHPEFTSRPLKPNPLFREFIKATNKK